MSKSNFRLDTFCIFLNTIHNVLKTFSILDATLGPKSLMVIN